MLVALLFVYFMVSDELCIMCRRKSSCCVFTIVVSLYLVSCVLNVVNGEL